MTDAAKDPKTLACEDLHRSFRAANAMAVKVLHGMVVRMSPPLEAVGGNEDSSKPELRNGDGQVSLARWWELWAWSHVRVEVAGSLAVMEPQKFRQWAEHSSTNMPGHIWKWQRRRGCGRLLLDIGATWHARLTVSCHNKGHRQHPLFARPAHAPHPTALEFAATL